MAEAMMSPMHQEGIKGIVTHIRGFPGTLGRLLMIPESKKRQPAVVLIILGGRADLTVPTWTGVA